MNRLQARLDQLYSHCRNHPDRDIRDDLMQIWRNCNHMLALCDRESVNCRRLNKTTSRFQDLHDDLLTAINLLEKRITWANLL